MQNSTQQMRRLHSKLRIVSRDYRITSMYLVLNCYSFIHSAGCYSKLTMCYTCRQLITRGMPAPTIT